MIDKLFDKRIIKKIVYLGLRVINRLTPKKHNQILFASIPDFSDNAKSLFEYMINKTMSSKYQALWTVSNKERSKKLQQAGIRAYTEKSIMGLYQFFRSKYIIVTHNHYGGIKTSNQFLINLWHGMPLKAMGFVDDLENKKYLLELKRGSKADDILIATSAVAKSALITCFFIDPRKVYITGQPRNDKLFSSESQEQNLMKILQIDISKYNRVVLFAPTFRKWGTRIEGIPQEDNVFNFDDYNAERFHYFLKKNKILFLLKPHPLEEELLLSKFEMLDGIILITSSMLQENLLDLYDIIGAVDILITDYSSIYFDFLLLNRPIIFVPTDFEEYSKSRGFVLEPYEFWTPGPKVFNFKDFLKELKICIENPNYYEKERKVVNEIINSYKDNKACERVWKAIENLSKAKRG